VKEPDENRDEGRDESRVIVVTGASGFLGGAVARAFATRGESVRALVRATSDTRGLRSAGIAPAIGDVVSGAGLDAAFDGATVVVHAAGMLGRAGAEDAEYERVHVDGTLNVLRAARTRGVARVVYVSSPGLLGPIARDAPAADEDTPPNPTNPYERSKAAAEVAVLEDAARNGPLAIVVRPEFVYGPGDHHVLRLVRAIQKRRFFYIGRGDSLCHPTYVDDAVAGLVAAADRGRPGRTYHVAGPRPLSIRELAETYARACDVSPPFVRLPKAPLRLALSVLEPLAARAHVTLPLGTSAIDFFTFDRHFSTERARNELGFEPKVDLSEGTRRTVRWYQSEGLL
jgi:nucleoside-diphosphate-sugar epimerase